MTRFPLVAATLALSILATVPHPVAADDPTRDEVCAEVTCRPATTVRLILQDGQIGKFVVNSRPYVIDGVVSVIAGETILLEAVPGGGVLADLRFVPAVANPERTVILKFEQDPEIGMILTVTNPFSRPMKYTAGIHRPGYDEFHRTTSCPVMPGTKTWEHWQEPLIQLLLFDFRFVDANDQQAMVCD